MTQLQKTLSFFRDVEIMEIPSAPKVARAPFPVTEFAGSYRRTLPWAERRFALSETMATFHLVCLGVGEMRPMIERLTTAIDGGRSVDPEEIARQRGTGFLGTILVDWMGRPVEKSLTPAPFVYAAERLIAGESLAGLEEEVSEKATQIMLAHFGRAEPAFALKHAKRGQHEDQKIFFDFSVHMKPLDYETLVRLGRGLASKLGIDPGATSFRVLSRTVRRGKGGGILVPDFSETVTPSFFVDDIRSVQAQVDREDISPALAAYLGPVSDPSVRIDLLCDHDAMREAVAPAGMPCGRWPANPAHPLCLAQQAAVGVAVDSSRPLVAINGPPGTGKTTLLRDVIAHAVVLRASRLVQMEAPGDAFSEMFLKKSSLPVIRSDIAEGTGILVVSNNNAAVENISSELPRRDQIDIGSFEQAAYLPGVADDVAEAFGEKAPDSWGLVALRMGNKANIDASFRGLDQPYGTDSTLQPQGLFAHLNALSVAPGEWDDVRQAFDEKRAQLDSALEERGRLFEALRNADGSVSGSKDDPEGNSDLGVSIPPLPRPYVVPDKAFFELDFEARHMSSTWVTPQIDQLRSEIFLLALKLHELVLYANRFEVRRMIYPLKRALSGQDGLTPQQLVKAWNTLFFIAPVVSTTLASVRRLPLVTAWIGQVLVDEAGQATPQSLSGVLQRARRSVVVGDPLQIEPVFTVPPAVVERLRERSGVMAHLSPATASAQSVADGTMREGSWVDLAGRDTTRIWTGIPLRVHRRCSEPMFSVANRIAYDGQMVQANPAPAMFDKDPGPSSWINIRAASAQDKVVAEEMKQLELEMIRLRTGWPQRSGLPASVFVISPFVSVAYAADQVVRRVLGKDAWKTCPVGTVHRFQGREADIVYLVLGSAPGALGEGSRVWAASQPNLLNVALTRARARIHVIGDFDAWSRQPYFSRLAQALPAPCGMR